MKNTTDKFSFILKPSTIKGAGVGVFALHDIAEGVHMELFLKDFEEETLNTNEVPKELLGYCLHQGNGRELCPKYFNRMDIGNYVNHSEEPNVRYKKGEGYFALKIIKAGEEILANYRDLGEPAETREEYYKN